MLKDGRFGQEEAYAPFVEIMPAAIDIDPPSSLPGLTPQVGFTRLAALIGADLGQARGPMQSIVLMNEGLISMDTRVSQTSLRSLRKLDCVPAYDE
jgi:hypothetical protein